MYTERIAYSAEFSILTASSGPVVIATASQLVGASCQAVTINKKNNHYSNTKQHSSEKMVMETVIIHLLYATFTWYSVVASTITHTYSAGSSLTHAYWVNCFQFEGANWNTNAMYCCSSNSGPGVPKVRLQSCPSLSSCLSTCWKRFFS